MQDFNTRIERLIYRKKKQRQKIKQTLSLCGIALTVAPLANTILPATSALATENQTNTTALIEQLGAYATPLASANDLYASIMVAQALLESGFGTSTLSQAPHYNLFGVKEYNNGSFVQMNTQEYVNGQWVTMYEPFATYTSYYDSFVGHVGVLTNTNYAGAWKSHSYSYQDAANYLTGRYATAPNYGSELIRIIQTYNLTRFDTGYQAVQAIQTAPSSVNGSYTVAAGDSIYGIADQLGISVDQLLNANGLQLSSAIHAGQQLAY